MKTRRVIASIAAVIALALAPAAAIAMSGHDDNYNPPKYEHPQTRVLPTL